MPITWNTLGSVRPGPITKSPVCDSARTPAKDVMRLSAGKPLTVFPAAASSSAKLSRRMTRPSREHSTDVGPTKKLPSVVGATSTPLPRSDGMPNTGMRTKGSLSNIRYSPAR